MDTQEWEIEQVDQAWLGFYDIISVHLEDGSELPIWAMHTDPLQEELEGDVAKLLLVSKKPITKQQALQVQEKLKDRSEIGCYFDIT